MPKTHHLKTLPAYFDAVCRGDKTFEIRKNDRDFQTGDTLVLEEFKGDPPHAPRTPGQPPLTREELGYTGEDATCVVSYTLHGPAFGLELGYVIMGLVLTDYLEEPTQRLDFTTRDDAGVWIKWEGGESPVPPKTSVDYRLRQDADDDYVTVEAGALRWSHLGQRGDIVAYRLAQ